MVPHKTLHNKDLNPPAFAWAVWLHSRRCLRLKFESLHHWAPKIFVLCLLIPLPTMNWYVSCQKVPFQSGYKTVPRTAARVVGPFKCTSNTMWGYLSCSNLVTWPNHQPVLLKQQGQWVGFASLPDVSEAVSIHDLQSFSGSCCTPLPIVSTMFASSSKFHSHTGSEAQQTCQTLAFLCSTSNACCPKRA
jgi:hypothetical protein